MSRQDSAFPLQANILAALDVILPSTSSCRTHYLGCLAIHFNRTPIIHNSRPSAPRRLAASKTATAAAADQHSRRGSSRRASLQQTHLASFAYPSSSRRRTGHPPDVRSEAADSTRDHSMSGSRLDGRAPDGKDFANYFCKYCFVRLRVRVATA